MARTTWPQYTPIHYPEDNFGSILEDDGNHVWFGTCTSGVYQFDGTDWVHHLPGQDVRPELVDKQGKIWAISDEAGVYAYDGEAWTRYGTAEGLASETVFDVLQAQDGALWFATDQGVTRYAHP